MLRTKPRVGDKLLFPSGEIVTVHHFGDGWKDRICYYTVDGNERPREGRDCFIWSFTDGHNASVTNLSDEAADALIFLKANEYTTEEVVGAYKAICDGGRVLAALAQPAAEEKR
jgi:hypothetical protein